MPKGILLCIAIALGAGLFYWVRTSSLGGGHLAVTPFVEVPAGYEISDTDLLPVTLERISSWKINKGMSLEALRQMYSKILPVDDDPHNAQVPDAGNERMEHYIVMLRRELESELSYQARQRTIPPSPDPNFVVPEIITRRWRSWKLAVSVTEAEKTVTRFSIYTDP